MGLTNPLPGGVITQHFGPSPMAIQPAMYHVGDESAWWNWYAGATHHFNVHAGTDFAGRVAGSPLVAMEAGRVIRSAYDADNGGGHVVEVEINPGVSYSLNHCQTRLVAYGATVRKGQTIATVGATGTILLPDGTRVRSTYGVHCHAVLTIARAGVTRLRNVADFLDGGKYATNPLVRPSSAAPRTVVVNVGVNLRRGPELGANVAYVARADGIYDLAGVRRFRAGSAFLFLGTTGGWGKLATGTGERLFVAAGLYR